MLLRLAYLGVTNALAMLRLLPMSDRDKDAESWPSATRSRSSSGNCTARGSDSPPLTGVAHRATAPTAPHRATSDPASGPPAINHLADSSPRPDGYS